MSRGRKVIVEADGGARGNPGPAGYGALVREADTGEVLAERSESIGVATNNVAEYGGLIAGLEAAVDVGATDVEVRMDSRLVVEQMSGRWQIKNPGLRPLAAKAASLVRRFDSVRYAWVPREHNRHADALANAAMDQAAGKPTTAPTAQASAPAAEAREVAAPDSSALAQAREVAAQARGRGAGARTSWEPRAATGATRLLLLRHGETELTAQRRYSGRGDVPLSPLGMAQAQAAAERIGQLVAARPESRVAAVVTSPLSRCTTTAEVISRRLGGVPVVVEPDLVECDFGQWEGRTFAEVRAQWPTELDDWLASTSVAPPSGESFAAVTTRVRRVAAKLLQSYPGGTVVVVSHVSPIKIMLRDALAAGDAFLHRLYLDAGGLSVVDTWPDAGVAVRSVNDTGHLANI